MKILVVGQGAREHALAWKIAQDTRVKRIFIAPGNGGTQALGENIPIKANDIEALRDFAVKEKIDLTVVGPEEPLVRGIVDVFSQKGLTIFGPSRELAMLEGSKEYAKKTMKRYNVPTARSHVFYDEHVAIAYIKSLAGDDFPIVIKASGLAAGKGVIIADHADIAIETIYAIMRDKIFGEAGQTVVIEEFLRGEELSVLAFVDGEHFLLMTSSQDHKRAFDGDKGPNTGGMGAYSPCPLMTSVLQAKIEEEVFARLLKGLAQEGKIYKGVLYAGLMIDKGAPKVLEFNVRSGDPETQAVLPKMKSNIVELMLATAESRLHKCSLEFDDDFCVCVVLASGGYPEAYEKGKKIAGLEAVDARKAIVFHAGTEKKDGAWHTSGGRVLGVTAKARDAKTAIAHAYQEAAKIRFEGMYYRKDIAAKALCESLPQ
jgi:phosphoribosylamine--glycine ligase